MLAKPSQTSCGADMKACDEPGDGIRGSTDVSHFLYVFLLAQVLHGLGAAPLWSLGIAYIDANVKKKLVSVSEAKVKGIYIVKSCSLYSECYC